MPEKKFELGDYVEVKDRIRILFELFPQARIETDYHLTAEPDDRPKVICRALVYRKPDDPKPAGFGTSWLYLPGSTPYTKGSEIENAETSAVGRAIGMLGILIDHSLASRQELDNKQGEQERAADTSDRQAHRPAPPRLPARPDPATEDPTPTNDPYQEIEELVGRVRRRGTIKPGTAEGFKLTDVRQTPDGYRVGFRLEVGPQKHIPQCLVAGPLGAALLAATGEKPDVLKGVGATVAGILYHVKNNRPDSQSWYRLHVDQIETTINGLEVVLPAPADGPPADVPLFGEDVA